MYFSVGISWTREVRSLLESGESPFNLSNCNIELEFTFDTEGLDCFTRKFSANSRVADFAILNVPNDTFQTEEIIMEFDTVDFNWFASPHTEKVS